MSFLGYQKAYLEPSLQTQGVNWTYIRRSEDVQDVFWTSCVRSIYVLCLRVWQTSMMKLLAVNRSSPPEVVLGKASLKMCSQFTREHPCWSAIFSNFFFFFFSIRVKFKFAAYFQNTFSLDHLRRAASAWTISAETFVIDFWQSPENATESLSVCFTVSVYSLKIE